jgi:hypothetical protein
MSLSRYADTPRDLLMELNTEATDYFLVGDTQEDSFLTNWDILRGVLDEAPQKLTRLDILDEWPPDHEKPGRVTLVAWLNRALERSLLAREGAGKKSDPYRYWLPEREEVWKKTIPLYDFVEEQNRVLNLPFESLRQKKGRDRADKRWEAREGGGEDDEY